MIVFTVFRKYTHVNVGVQVNERPSLIAFTSKRSACAYISLQKSLCENRKPMQPLVIETTQLETLKERCSLNALDLTLYTDSGSYEVIKTDMRHPKVMLKHFEHSFYL